MANTGMSDQSTKKLTGRRIGFVSTRFAGTDGVSLETDKWARVLERLGHTCFYFAGESDRPAARSRVVPEAFFGNKAIDAISSAVFMRDLYTDKLSEGTDPAIYSIHAQAFANHVRPPAVTHSIHELCDFLKQQLYAFAHDFDLELLIVENALAIPMNIPLGLALTEFIVETGLPTLAHHHDFYWERPRFAGNCVGDYLNMAFPPTLPTIRHVVINSIAAGEFSRRTGLSAMLIPNVMDFDEPSPLPKESAAQIRSDLGVASDEKFFLQPTRVVQRKGIEHAIELTKRVGLKARLVISNASGDEGDDYEQRVKEYAELLGVPVNFEAELIRDQRSQTADGRTVYKLWDVYPCSDLVTYPSSIEGFGNAFLEAVYFRRPIVVNNYSIFKTDIKPKGFRVIEFDDYITDATIEQTRQVLTHPQLAHDMAEENYQLAKRHYSYAVLQRRLQTLIADCFGEE